MDLKNLRASRDLDQTLVARHVGVNVRDVQRWENGERRPPVGKLWPLARVLQVSLEDLMLSIGETEALVFKGSP